MNTTDRFSLKKIVALACIGIAGAVGCGGGGGGSGNNVDARVVSIVTTPNPVAVGQGTIISDEFSFSANRVFDDNEHVEVVLFIPNGLAYREGTAEIDRPTGEDRSVGPQAFPCANGTYLLFDLDDTDLLDATNPNGDADGRLKLTIDALTPSSGLVVATTARNNGVPFTCQGGLIADATVTVIVQ